MYGQDEEAPRSYSLRPRNGSFVCQLPPTLESVVLEPKAPPPARKKRPTLSLRLTDAEIAEDFRMIRSSPTVMLPSLPPSGKSLELARRVQAILISFNQDELGRALDITNEHTALEAALDDYEDSIVDAAEFSASSTEPPFPLDLSRPGTKAREKELKAYRKKATDHSIAEKKFAILREATRIIESLHPCVPRAAQRISTQEIEKELERAKQKAKK